jgi:hypothetical protein
MNEHTKHLIYDAILIVITIVITVYAASTALDLVQSSMDKSITMMIERVNSSVCANLTPDTYNSTPHHEWCVFNDTTGRYEMGAINLQNG